MISLGRRPVGSQRRRRVVALGLGALLITGCGAFRRQPIDVPPGHRIVLGEIVTSGFATPQLILELTREDGSFQEELPIDFERSPFVMTLPPGHYLITRIRVNEMGRTGPESSNFRLAITFDVNDPAVYIGTVRIERVSFLRQLRVTVVDEYEQAVPAMRGRHPELPAEITRSLARPG